jgi:transcriptional regulator with XRE-family HTH domain
MYERIKKLCKRNGISINYLEKILNFSRGSLCKIDKNTPSTDKLNKIAKYFNVSIDYLLGNSYIENVGRIIKEERERLGISQEEIAEQAGISVHSLDRYETLDEPIREDILNDITDALGTTVPELLHDNCMYDEYIPDRFDGDVEKYEAFQKAQDDDAVNGTPYYLNDDAKEMAQFLYDNPEYKVLFDASRKVKKEDIDFVKQMIDRMRSDPDDTGC